MDALVAKRYVKALKKSFKTNELVKIDTVFSTLSDSLKQPRIARFMENPEISRKDKIDILLETIKSVKSEKLNNFFRLLVQNGRFSIIPSISKILKEEISSIKNSYVGYIYSNEALDNKSLVNLSRDLSSKIGARINLQYIKNDFNGIKIDVKDLGIEIDFSQTKIDSQIINHILKAI